MEEHKIRKIIDKFKDFVFGRICPKCKKGRMSIINLDDKTVECAKCHYKEKDKK